MFAATWERKKPQAKRTAASPAPIPLPTLPVPLLLPLISPKGQHTPRPAASNPEAPAHLKPRPFPLRPRCPPAPLPAQFPAVREPRPQRFLFVSKYGLIHDLAWEVKKEGHDVRYHIMQKSERDVGDGFVEKVERWEDCKEWADLIVFDDCEFGAVADRLRAEGKRVVGGTPYTDRLEMDRDFGQEEMRSAGLTTLPRWEFGSFDAAIAFIKASPGRYVIKPSGRAQNEKVLSFVGQEEDGLDVLTMLEHYRNGWGSKIKSFQLQKYASGVEVAVGAFFNGTEFLQPAFINFEHKRMFNDDIGPQTGEMGTSGFWLGASTLFQQTLHRMKDRLAAARYCGYVDINCIANSRGIYPLEFTCRFGYPTINLQMEGMLSRWSELLTAMGRGQTGHASDQEGVPDLRGHRRAAVPLRGCRDLPQVLGGRRGDLPKTRERRRPSLRHPAGGWRLAPGGQLGLRPGGHRIRIHHGRCPPRGLQPGEEHRHPQYVLSNGHWGAMASRRRPAADLGLPAVAPGRARLPRIGRADAGLAPMPPAQVLRSNAERSAPRPTRMTKSGHTLAQSRLNRKTAATPVRTSPPMRGPREAAVNLRSLRSHIRYAVTREPIAGIRMKRAHQLPNSRPVTLRIM